MNNCWKHRITVALVVACGSLLLTATASFAALGSFTTDYSTSAPVNLSPVDAASIEYPDDPLSFSWDRVAGSTKYQLQISHLENAGDTCAFTSNLVVYDETVTDNAYVPSFADEASEPLHFDGTYCWRVRPTTGITGGTWSDANKYLKSWAAEPDNLAFLNDSSEIPRAAAPPYVSDASTSYAGYLTWDQVAGASGYEVQVASHQNFADDSIIIRSVGDADAGGSPGNAMVIPHLPDDTYFWRVRTIDPFGAHGEWVDGEEFSIAWTTMDYSPGSVYPDDGATITEYLMGWNPVPGASSYQVQMASDPGCFWDPEIQDGAPEVTTCRLSGVDQRTINNWATLEELDDDFEDNANFPAQVYWRTRPISEIASSTETNWVIGEGGLTTYGRWLETADNTHPFQYTNAQTPVPDEDGDRCDGASNTSVSGEACLVQVGTQMSPTDVSEDSDSMQMPVFKWNAFDMTSAPGLGYSYRLQISRDPNFDVKVVDKVVASGYGAEFQTSYSMSTALPDNAQGTGYWWRVVPCRVALPGDYCIPLYYIAAAGIAGAWAGQPFADTAGAHSFTKDVNIVPTVEENFDAWAPLISWDAVDGTDHYEIEFSETPNFVTSTVGATTVPRYVPHTGTGDSLGEIADGLWYFRVRAVDADDVVSGWSATDTFVKEIDAPTLSSPSDDATTDIPLLKWNTVTDASGYEVRVTPDGLSSTTYSTVQRALRLPSVATETTYTWRVRAVVASHKGTWSSERTVTVIPQPFLTYSVSKSTLYTGTIFHIMGTVNNGGTLDDGETVALQRKSASCASSSGSYTTVDSGITGTNSEQGNVRFGRVADQNRCYRLRWRDGAGDYHHSAPIKTLVRPLVSVSMAKILRRGSPFTTYVKVNKRISGTARLQFRKYGNPTWKTVKTRSLSAVTSFTFRTSVQYTGSHYTRVSLTNMGSYYDTVRNGPYVRVNDLWSYYG